MFVARLANIYPEDLIQAAKADMVCCLAQDMSTINPILNRFDCESEEWKEKHQIYFISFSDNIRSAERIIGDNRFFGGDSVCHADFAMLHIVDASLSVEPDCLSDHSVMQVWLNRMKTLPSVHEYMTTRPKPPQIGFEGSFLLNKLKWTMFWRSSRWTLSRNKNAVLFWYWSSLYIKPTAF